MVKEYLKTALREIARHRGYSFIKILGLSIGIAACILIYLFVADELSFDNFHRNGDKLFRVLQVQFDKTSGAETGFQQFIPTPVGPGLIRSVPEVLRQSRFVTGQGTVRRGPNIFNEELTLVDPSFLRMFSFPLLAGDPASALSDRHQLVVTQSQAAKYFGPEDPLGKTVTITFGRSSQDFLVTGVARDVPPNSTLRFDILIPIDNLPAESNDPGILDDWNRWYCPLFVQLRPKASPAGLAPKLDRFCRQYYGAAMERDLGRGQDPFTFGLQRVRDMHLDRRVGGVAGLSTSYLLSAIALAILLIACFNFINLSLGLSSTRSVEVGVRKVLGAGRSALWRQFGSEALVVSFFAGALGLWLSSLLVPAFNILSGKHLSLATFFGGAHGLALLGIIVLTGLLAGAYPAAVMSSFRPVEIMKGKLRVGGRSPLAKGLVVVQFALSVILGVSAVLLGRQASFLIHRDPGYASRGLVVVLTQESEPLASERIYRRFRNEAVSHDIVRGVSASNREFGLFLPSSALELGERRILYRFNRVDPDFLKTMEIPLLQGRDFSPNVAADSRALIMNRRFAEELGPDYRLGDVLGDPSRGFPYDCRVIGVIGDCHFASLRQKIEPLILYVGDGPSPRRNTFSRIMVRLEAGHPGEALPVLERVWRKVSPDKPFVSYFQDDALRSLYEREIRWSVIIRFASGLSLLLACLGVFGLTSLTLNRRVKEIGIRKVLGAGAGQIILLASRELVLLVSAANLIAGPVVFFAMKRVLADYPYRIAIAPSYFILAWLASTLIGVLTILYLSAKAALRNPVESLRYE
jgi:putative ABC transport system permease protein